MNIVADRFASDLEGPITVPGLPERSWTELVHEGRCASLPILLVAVDLQRELTYQAGVVEERFGERWTVPILRLRKQL